MEPVKEIKSTSRRIDGVTVASVIAPAPIITVPQNKRPTVYIYPTVSPESIVVPIVSCILGFPLLTLMIICCLRRRAKLARERARRRNCELKHGGRSRAVSFHSERAMSRGFPSLELDTVVEERSDPDPEGITTIEILTPPDGGEDDRR